MKPEIKREREPELWAIHPDFPMYTVSTYGKVYTYKNQKLLKPAVNHDGYLAVTLYNYLGRRTIFIHNLMLEIFVSLRPKGHECRHYPNQDPADNYIGNISWATHAVNNHDNLETGSEKIKLSDKKILAIKQDIKDGVFLEDVAKKHGMSKALMSNIKRGELWSTVGEDLSKLDIERKPLKLFRNQVCLIKILLKENKLTQLRISELFDVCPMTISNIKTGKTHWDVIPLDISYEDASIIYNNGGSLLLV